MRLNYEVLVNVHVRHTDKAAVLTARGALKLGHPEHDFRKTFEDLLEQGITNMVVNLAGVPEIDSSGVGALIRVFTSARRAGGRVCYFGAPRRVMQMLKMVRLDNVLELFEDEESALSSF